MAKYNDQSCLHQLFEAQVERTPGAIALVYEDEKVTYRELNGRANQLAHYLRTLGVGPEVLVGICVERSIEMVVGLLGILKAGGAYVPLDPTYPKERLMMMLRDSQIALLLTQQRLVERVAGCVSKVLCLDSDWAEASAQNDQNLLNITTGMNLAYVIYTSGSTGEPKGVMIPHRGLANYLQWASETYRVAEGSGAPVHSSIGFDLTITSLFVPLLGGKRVVLLEEEGAVEGLSERLRQEPGYSLVKITPAHVEGLSQLLRGEELKGAARALIIGGEALFAESLAPWRRHAPETRLINEYGPTEAVVGCCVYEVSGPVSSAVPIGRPIANAQIYLLDPQQRPVPVAVAGEIYIGGEGLARGYLKRPELTAERFVPNPFATEPGARLYRTGDLGRHRADGNLEYLGRLDHQVKIRGFRIELGEIEAVLQQQRGIRESVVLVREDVAGDKRLVAYIVVEHELSISELRSCLSEKLPTYMVPSAFVKLQAMPLTPNGKLDRKALPAPDESRPELASSFVSPRTSTEQTLAEIFSDVLRLERVGVFDNFFDLGGHSLLATQFISRLREVRKVELPMRTFFQTPTIAQLAAVVEEQSTASNGHELLEPHRIGREGDLPLSFSQERVWFMHQLNPTNLAYNSQSTLRFQGTLEVPALEKALSEIVRRHEIFRTTFHEVDGRPAQIIHEAAAVRLPVIELLGFPVSEREGEAQRIISQELQSTFDLAQLPLVRWVLLQLDAQEHLLLHHEHHLLHDGWSFNVFLSELCELYQAYVSGTDSPLPELPVQFVDFAAWQRQWMKGEEAAKQIKYWKEKLAGAPALLKLPLDHARPTMPSFRGAAPRIELPLELCQQLRVVARQQQVTLFMLMYAAFVILLHRYSGEEELCVGSGIANRRWRETEPLIGMLVNNVVLRNDLRGNPSLAEFLKQVREVMLEAYANQDVPFDKVVEALQPERGLNYNPLFQVMFSFHDSPIRELDLPGLKTTLTEAISSKAAKWDMNVIVIPRSEQHIRQREENKNEGITILWEYSSDLFEASTIDRLAGYYQTLLEGIVEDANKGINELPMLNEEERRKLLLEWNQTDSSYSHNACVHHLFQEQVDHSPDSIALVCEDRRLSYRQVNERANQLAHFLVKLGVGPETIVAVGLERSLDMIVALLAILKAGGAYLPVDSTLPKERLSFMLDDAQVKIILTEQRWLEVLPDHTTKIVCLDTDWKAISQESRQNVANAVTAENLAYVMYTSGSTGQPKGVSVTHRAVVRLVKQSNYVEVKAADVFLQLAPISFDASTFEVWGSLLNGARLVLMSAGRPSLAELGAAIRRHGVTTLWLTAGLFQLMVDQQLEDLQMLKQLLAGGDVLSVAHVRKYLQAGGGKLINGYGPTENTTFTCCHVMTDGAGLDGSVPIGRPIANTQVYVLDGGLEPVPVGAVGELYTSGDGLARGYLNRPELTAAKFIPNPFSHRPGERLYKTGDRVRYRPSGLIEFIGREDHQVKLRGFRIEPGEVEAALEQHPSVRESVLTVRTDASGDKRLVAYVVPKGQGTAVSELRDFLKEKLPEYMVPSVFVLLEALPLTVNGKVDRAALPVPVSSSANQDESHMGARTEIEEMVAQIWTQVLDDSVGIHDNFFELGGHSLLATQVLSRVKNVFQVELKLRHLFENPTVAALSRSIATALRGDKITGAATPIRRVSREGQLPLSFAQQRLWFLDRLMPDSPFYNILLAYRLRGELDLKALEQSINEIIKRHEALRTRFNVVAGEPVQIIEQAQVLCVEVVELGPDAEQEQRLDRMALEEKQRPFDLSEGALLRAKLIRLEQQDHVLLVTMHHIVSDGWSMNVFIRELDFLYEAYRKGLEPALEELDVQYADYAVWQREWLTGAVMDEQLAYWKEQLLGAPEVVELPTDYARPLVQSDRGGNVRFAVQERVTRALKEIGQREGATLFMTMLAAYGVLLGRYSGQTEVVIGTPIANRTRAEVEKLIGFFANTLPLRLKLGRGDISFRELVRQVKEVCLGAYGHQDVPFEKLVEELRPERSLSRTPLFQVVFSLQNAPRKTFESPELTLTEMDFDVQKAKFDLNMEVTEDRNCVKGRLIYNADLFAAGTIGRMVEHFNRLLHEIVAQPDTCISDLEMLLDEERTVLARAGAIEDLEVDFSIE